MQFAMTIVDEYNPCQTVHGELNIDGDLVLLDGLLTRCSGGLIMSLTDTLGSLAVSTQGHWMTGVSTDIGTSFVRPSGRPGDILNARASLISIGG
jgi:acyl-coenzyme A thioesterase PaaI-like protein